MQYDDRRLMTTLFREICLRDHYGLRAYPHTAFNLIVDIGANMGVFSLLAKLSQPFSRVVAFEPTPRTFELLNANVAGLHVDTKRAALGNGSVLRLKRGSCSGGNTFVPDGEGIEIKTQTISELLKDIEIPKKSFLKIDCEGGESCLLNCPESLRVMKQFKHIAMELHYGGTHHKAWDWCPTQDEFGKWINLFRPEYDIWCRSRRGLGRLIMCRKKK